MTNISSGGDKQRVFESFLPYRDALYLARWVQGLLTLRRLLNRGGPVAENFCWGAGISARHLAPQIRPAGQSEEEFLRTIQRERQREGLSEDELGEMLEEEAEELREKIDSGEIDIWDDTPVWVDRGEVEDFISRSLDYLESKVCPACRAETSLLERLIPQAVDILRRGDEGRTHYAALLVWDYARMYHEGEPPYRIVFSSQVAETLGIDPQMESIRMQEMKPLRRPEARRLREARKLIRAEGKVLSPGEIGVLSDVLRLDQALRKHSLEK